MINSRTRVIVLIELYVAENSSIWIEVAKNINYKTVLAPRGKSYKVSNVWDLCHVFNI